MQRQFKAADLLSILYRYLPNSTVIHVSDKHLEPFGVAFTHESIIGRESYQRTEFLGDSINTSILTAYIFHRYPNQDEGFLTRLRSHLISGRIYTEVSRQLGLSSWICFKDDTYEHLRSKACIQEDVYEAFVGAMFLAFGFHITEAWVVKGFEEYVDCSAIVREVLNPKERLVNFSLSTMQCKPRFETSSNQDGMFKTKVFHPQTDDFLSEGHGATVSKSVSIACKTAMEIIARSHVL